MSDKVKSELLIDYIISIVPPNIVNGIDKGLKYDFSFHNKLLYYYLGNNTANSLQQYRNYSAPLTRKCQKSVLIISKLVLGLFPNSC